MTKAYLKFGGNSPEMIALTDWWQELDKNRGDRAELRRCATLTEVAITPAYHRLRLAVMQYGIVNDNSLAVLAGLAARIKSDFLGGTVAEQMATGKPDGSARVSGLRFRRLLKIKDAEHFFIAMGRVIALLGGAMNLQNLANSVYYWNDKTRKQWAFDYYSKSPSEK